MDSKCSLKHLNRPSSPWQRWKLQFPGKVSISASECMRCCVLIPNPKNGAVAETSTIMNKNSFSSYTQLYTNKVPFFRSQSTYISFFNSLSLRNIRSLPTCICTRNEQRNWSGKPAINTGTNISDTYKLSEIRKCMGIRKLVIDDILPENDVTAEIALVHLPAIVNAANLPSNAIPIQQAPSSSRVMTTVTLPRCSARYFSFRNFPPNSKNSAHAETSTIMTKKTRFYLHTPLYEFTRYPCRNHRECTYTSYPYERSEVSHMLLHDVNLDAIALLVVHLTAISPNLSRTPHQHVKPRHDHHRPSEVPPKRTPRIRRHFPRCRRIVHQHLIGSQQPSPGDQIVEVLRVELSRCDFVQVEFRSGSGIRAEGFERL